MRNLLHAARWLLLLPLLLAAGLAHGAHSVSVISPQTNYQVEILSHDGVEYVGLTDLMEPLGRVESHVEGNRVRFLFNGTESMFEQGNTQCRVRSTSVNLPAGFLLQDGRGYVPLASVSVLLPRMAELTAEMHPATRRLFVGVASIHYTAELRTSPSRLVLSFTAPVNPSTYMEKSRVRLLFRREPVVGAASSKVTYSDPFVRGVTFNESAAGAELNVQVAQPATVTVGDGGRSLTISPSQPAAAPGAQAQNAPASTPLAATSSPGQPTAQGTPTAARAPRGKAFVMLDAAHGGADAGAATTPAEKVLTLALARRVQKELEAKGISVVLARTSDVALSFDQRAAATNTARVSLYVAIHLSPEGHGARVYAPMLPPAPAEQDHRAFLPWELAQTPYLERSGQAATSVAGDLNTAGVKAQSSAVALRPLNSVTAPAIAVEFAPLEGGEAELATPAYQQKMATALAGAIAALRGRWGEAQ
jgi:N-acetylmuramoyl-L-alanine amidase